MAKITLPTNYRDDILNSSAEGKRKYVMSYNQDGTVSFEDVTPYEQVGSDFGAGDINTANEAINESFDKNKLVKDLDTINALTEEGFAPDALAVKQLNESLGGLFKLATISKQVTVNAKSYLNVAMKAEIPNGYSAIAMKRWTVGNLAQVACSGVVIALDGSVNVGIYNPLDSVATPTITVHLLLVKSGCISQ